MKNMVRKAASKKMAEQATDMKADPGYADLYVPRKSGDPTGQSKIINETLAPGLSAETSGPEAEQVNAQIRQPASPIQLGAPTKFNSVPITNGLRTAGANIPGKPRVFMPYAGGLPRYTEVCDKIKNNNYKDFILN